jgi:hypothetical protein
MRGKVVPLDDIKVCGEVKVYHHSFLTSALCKYEYSALRSSRFGKEKNLLLLLGIEPRFFGPPVYSQVSVGIRDVEFFHH